MKFTLSKEILEKFPNAGIGILVVHNVDNTKAKDQTYQVLWDQIEKTAKEIKPVPGQSRILGLKEVTIWTDAFSKVGFDTESLPSHAALLSRVENRKSIPNINSLVNIYNKASIKYKIPLGGHDLDKIDGNITVGPNVNNCSFTEMNTDKPSSKHTDKQSDTPTAEIVYADEKDVLTRKWVWHQGDKSKTTKKTTSIFIPIDDLGQHSEKELKEIAAELKSLIHKFLATKQTTFNYGLINKKQNSIDLDRLKPLKESSKTEIMKTYTIKHDPDIIEKLITRAVETIIPSPDTLKKMLLSGRRLNVYQGFDPTADTLHIGHTAGMRKLRYFQQLGHNVIFLMGDFTARIGDPSDKTSARKKLTKAQVEENLKLYKKQAGRILDLDDKDNPVTIMFNSHWLDKLNFQDITELASEFTVQQMIKRDMFQERLKEDRPIYIHEFMYPLMQGYDAFHMNVDVEVGGNDQMFNMACGRDLVLKWLNKEKVVLPNKMLEDPTGKKMGKTEGNMIMLSDKPEDIYGKVMAFTDGMITPAYEILTEIPMTEIKQMEDDMKNEKVNPMVLKKELAFIITAEHKGKSAADKAQKYFEDVFQNGEAKETEIPIVKVNKKEVPLVELLVDHLKFAPSNSQAKRLIKQGAVKVGTKTITAKGHIVKVKKGVTVRAGKKIAKIEN